MKLITLLLLLVASCKADIVPIVQWDIETGRMIPVPYSLSIRRGESVNLEPRFVNYNVPINLTGAAVQLRFWYTGQTGYYAATGSLMSATGRVHIAWSDALCPASNSLNYEVRATVGTNVLARGYGPLRLLPGSSGSQTNSTIFDEINWPTTDQTGGNAILDNSAAWLNVSTQSATSVQSALTLHTSPTNPAAHAITNINGLVDALAGKAGTGTTATVSYGTDTNTAYRGDWGAAVSSMVVNAGTWTGSNYVTASITNGLPDTNYVAAAIGEATNGLGGGVSAADVTNSLDLSVSPSLTNIGALALGAVQGNDLLPYIDLSGTITLPYPYISFTNRNGELETRVSSYLSIENGIKDLNGNITFEPNILTLYDASSIESIKWGSRILVKADGSNAVDYSDGIQPEEVGALSTNGGTAQGNFNLTNATVNIATATAGNEPVTLDQALSLLSSSSTLYLNTTAFTGGAAGVTNRTLSSTYSPSAWTVTFLTNANALANNVYLFSFTASSGDVSQVLSGDQTARIYITHAGGGGSTLTAKMEGYIFDPATTTSTDYAETATSFSVPKSNTLPTTPITPVAVIPFPTNLTGDLRYQIRIKAIAAKDVTSVTLWGGSNSISSVSFPVADSVVLVSRGATSGSLNGSTGTFDAVHRHLALTIDAAGIAAVGGLTNISPVVSPYTLVAINGTATVENASFYYNLGAITTNTFVCIGNSMTNQLQGRGFFLDFNRGSNTITFCPTFMTNYMAAVAASNNYSTYWHAGVGQSVFSGNGR